MNNKRKRNNKLKVSLSNINIKRLLKDKVCVYKLDPNYITGFAQSDGTFFVTVSKEAKYK